jgi:hypothetical protein
MVYLSMDVPGTLSSHTRGKCASTTVSDSDEEGDGDGDYEEEEDYE